MESGLNYFSTTVNANVKMPELSAYPIIRCYNVPPATTAAMLESEVKRWLNASVPTDAAFHPYSIKHVLPPQQTFDSLYEGVSWKIVCSDQRTFEALLGKGSMPFVFGQSVPNTTHAAITTNKPIAPPRSSVEASRPNQIPELSEQQLILYFTEGNPFDVPYDVPDSSSASQTSHAALSNR